MQVCSKIARWLQAKFWEKKISNKVGIRLTNKSILEKPWWWKTEANLKFKKIASSFAKIISGEIKEYGVKYDAKN